MRLPRNAVTAIVIAVGLLAAVLAVTASAEAAGGTMWKPWQFVSPQAAYAAVSVALAVVARTRLRYA